MWCNAPDVTRLRHAAVLVVATLSLAGSAFAQQDEREREKTERVADILTALGARRSEYT
jgi:hypothetical protein